MFCSAALRAPHETTGALQREQMFSLLTPSERTLVASLRGSPAALAFVDTDTSEPFDPVQIGGPGTFGDLAVMTNDGQYVYATFDGGATGTGGVTVVDARTRRVVKSWAYPGQGRPHGIGIRARRCGSNGPLNADVLATR
jgi:hypothetical protein